MLGQTHGTHLARSDSSLYLPWAMTVLPTLALAATLGGGSVDVSISEIRTDQPGDDDEFFEVLPEPGASLDGLSYVVIADGGAGSGVVESITDLTGSATDGSGLLVFAESSFGLGTADLTGPPGFQNGDKVTHALLRDFTGALKEGLDDGVPDIFPWSEVIDAVSLLHWNPAAATMTTAPPSASPTLAPTVPSSPARPSVAARDDR